MKKYIINGLILGILLLFTFSVNAQNKKAKKKAPAAVAHLKGKIIDESGKSLPYVSIISDEGAITEYTDKNGNFQFNTPQGSVILIEFPGYDDMVIDLKSQSLPSEIVLKSDLLASEKDLIDRLDGGDTYRRYHVGAVETVSIEALKKYNDLTVNTGMQGLAAGLITRPNNGGIGYNSADFYVRGQHTTGDNKAIVIIDGILRPMDDILVEEIGSIEILKDAASKILYGPAAANGVISITTKRGEINKRILRISAESGAMVSTRSADYLNSYDYARLYNEARRNDGLSDLYLPHQLDGYKNSTGAYDLLYPNVDYKSLFTRNESLYKKATLESFGGNDKAKYAVVLGYTGVDGLEKVGKRSGLNRFSVRGNLDLKVNDFITAKADVAGRMELKDWGRRDAAYIYSTAIATHRPNEYPLTIRPEDINLPVSEDGIPYFGTSERVSDNLYADLKYGGNTSERYASNQANLGLDFNFDKFISGLKASVYATFDNYNYLRQQLVNTYPTYAIESYQDENGDEQIRYTQMRKISLNKDYSIASNETSRTSGWRADIGYEKSSGLHDFSAYTAYRFYKSEYPGTSQDVIDANYSLRLNYMYNKRYIIETDFAYMGSNKFDKGNKFFSAGAIGAAWVISNEDFMKSANNINFLKLKADYGVLGFSGNTGYDLFKTTWHENGTIGFNEQNNTKEYITTLTRYGNPDLKWERSNELNIGIEGLFFNNRLRGEVNYFNEKRSDIIGLNGSLYNSYIGDYGIVENMGEVRNQGFDAGFNWKEKVNVDFGYNIGLNLTYSKNKLLAWNENSNIEDYRKLIGQPTSALVGLQALGLFGRDVALSGHPVQTFGPYQNGDVAYADLNGDGIVDGRDVTIIGNNFPTIAWGLNTDIQYKNWGLYILGTAETGVNQLLTNGYYWNTGLGKYSTMTLDRYHEIENPSGTYPRLTSTDGDNSFRHSSFWIGNAAFLRLKNVELSYTFSNRKTTSFYKKIKVYASGTNLFVLSAIKDLDPERISAGVTNYPVYMNITGGLAVTF